MWDKILKIMEPDRETVSFYSRMENMNKLFHDNGLYDELWEPQPAEPLSIVWAVSSFYPEVFEQQLGSVLQMPKILREDDQIVFVIDKQRQQDTADAIANVSDYLDTKQIIIEREVPGDRPTFNWDIGLEYAEHDRVLFIRDLCLFFQPWDLIRTARTVMIDKKLHISSVILGPVWSRFVNRWVYLVHPRYAPNPFLFCFVGSKREIQKMHGFDQVFRRGFDHLGDVDFLLRWVLAGNTPHFISENMLVLHPGLVAESPEELNRMQFESSITRRNFYDRYGEEFINRLKPPFRLETPVIEVNHALTMDPLSSVIREDLDVGGWEDMIRSDGRGNLEFSKRDPADFILEVR
jgi:hypothetical protein